MVARRLFNVCYLPAIVNGRNHPLKVYTGTSGPGITCNHNSVMSGAIGDYNDDDGDLLGENIPLEFAFKKHANQKMKSALIDAWNEASGGATLSCLSSISCSGDLPTPGTGKISSITCND